MARKSEKTHESVKLVGDTLPRESNAIWNQVPMSESKVTESIVNTANPVPVSAPNSMHAGASDLRMLAQVEKWMAMIREINCEQHSEPAFQR